MREFATRFLHRLLEGDPGIAQLALERSRAHALRAHFTSALRNLPEREINARTYHLFRSGYGVLGSFLTPRPHH